MSETKFTPGPWIVWADRNDRYEVGPSTNYTVAQMMRTPLHGQYANAHLIAAAPMLYEALKGLLLDVKAANATGTFGLELEPGIYQAQVALKAARREA